MNAVRPPRAAQVKVATDVVRWYVQTHFRRPGDPGVVEMFCDPERVGAFAVDRAALGAGDERALFRLLVTTAMFQRRQDVQIMRILRGIGRRDATELTDARRLLKLVDATPCAHMKSVDSLRELCDLAKHPVTREGCCTRGARVPCPLKRHTVLLKRYGHFGKVPTSLALVLRQAGASDLGALRRDVFARHGEPLDRARALESALSEAWRINRKIASMFLSAVTNPDLSPGLAPWSEGLDWTYFVVVDSNVDLFLAAIGYRGTKTYDARREFVRALARCIDLRVLDDRLNCFNPRLVQQALYLFMSVANRRATPGDCMHGQPTTCSVCPASLATRCLVRPT